MVVYSNILKYIINIVIYCRSLKTVKEVLYTGCPNKHGNRVKSSKSSLLL